MQRPGAAERHQREAARVDAALDAHHAQRAEHRGLGDAHDSLRAGDRLELQLVGQARDRALGRGPVEREAAGERRVLEQPPEQQVGVGDGRLAPAASVARRPGIGPGGGGPHAQRAAGVAPGDRAAAGADGVDVERRQRQRAPGDRALGGLGNLAAIDQADVAGGAAHVEAQHVGLPRELCQQERPADAAGGAGEHRQRRVRARVGKVGEAAGGLHDLRLGHAEGAGVAGQAAEIGGQQGGEGGVERGRGGALVLAERADELARERHVRAGQELREQGPEQPLVRGVGVGMKQRHGDRLRRGVGEPGDQLARLAGVERAQRAVGPHALGHGEAQLGRHERRRSGLAQPIEVRPVLSRQLDHVGEAGGGEQRGARGVALQQRVGGDGHAVREALDFMRVRAGPREDLAHRREHGDGLIGGRRGELGGVDARVVAEQDGVGEGAADIHAQEHPGSLRQVHAAASSRFSVSARCWWEGQ